MSDLLLAVLCVIELGSSVCVFHSVAHHAVEEPSEFGGPWPWLPPEVLVKLSNLLQPLRATNRLSDWSSRSWNGVPGERFCANHRYRDAKIPTPSWSWARSSPAPSCPLPSR